MTKLFGEYGQVWVSPLPPSADTRRNGWRVTIIRPDGMIAREILVNKSRRPATDALDVIAKLAQDAQRFASGSPEVPRSVQEMLERVSSAEAILDGDVQFEILWPSSIEITDKWRLAQLVGNGNLIIKGTDTYTGKEVYSRAIGGVSGIEGTMRRNLKEYGVTDSKIAEFETAATRVYNWLRTKAKRDEWVKGSTAIGSAKTYLKSNIKRGRAELFTSDEYKARYPVAAGDKVLATLSGPMYTGRRYEDGENPEWVLRDVEYQVDRVRTERGGFLNALLIQTSPVTKESVEWPEGFDANDIERTFRYNVPRGSTWQYITRTEAERDKLGPGARWRIVEFTVLSESKKLVDDKHLLLEYRTGSSRSGRLARRHITALKGTMVEFNQYEYGPYNNGESYGTHNRLVALLPTNWQDMQDGDSTIPELTDEEREDKRVFLQLQAEAKKREEALEKRGRNG